MAVFVFVGHQWCSNWVREKHAPKSNLRMNLNQALFEWRNIMDFVEHTRMFYKASRVLLKLLSGTPLNEMSVLGRTMQNLLKVLNFVDIQFPIYVQVFTQRIELRLYIIIY